MAEIEEGLATYLLAYAGLTVLIGARFYPDDRPQEITTLPAVTMELVSEDKDHFLTGQSDLERPVYQLTVYAATLTSAKAVSNQLKAALCDYAGTMSGITVQYIQLQGEDRETLISSDGSQERLFIINLEFEVNYVRA